MSEIRERRLQVQRHRVVDAASDATRSEMVEYLVAVRDLDDVEVVRRRPSDRDFDHLESCTNEQVVAGRRPDGSPSTVTDVYVRLGIVEGFIGITVLEAQAMAVPTVSFRADDVQLAIEDGVTGLLADDAMAARIGRAGHERYLDTYALDGVVDRLEQLYASFAKSLTTGAA